MRCVEFFFLLWNFVVELDTCIKSKLSLYHTNTFRSWQLTFGRLNLRGRDTLLQVNTAKTFSLNASEILPAFWESLAKIFRDEALIRQAKGLETRALLVEQQSKFFLHSHFICKNSLLLAKPKPANPPSNFHRNLFFVSFSFVFQTLFGLVPPWSSLWHPHDIFTLAFSSRSLALMGSFWYQQAISR